MTDQTKGAMGMSPVKKSSTPLYILLDDVRRFAPVPIDEFLDGKTVTDALGRDWVVDDDARQILAQADAAWRKESELRSEHAAWLQDRAARRQALMAKVGADVLAGRQLTASNQGFVREAQREALGAFDRKEPELGYYEWRESK